MNQVPVLSVIVPSYNMEKYLPKCLGSLVVAPELMDRLEVLVVNDGSKDRTSEIAHEFAAKWPQTFRVIDKKNGNYGSCINAALPVVAGTYVKILDADDYVDTNAFADFVRFVAACVQETGNVDLIVSDYDEVDEEGNVTDKKDLGLGADATTLHDKRPGTPRLPVHSVVYRVENLKSICYHQTEGMSYTDTEWIIRPMPTIEKLRYFPRVVTHYLVGRVGQTMEATTFTRRFQQVADITEDLVKEYRQCSMQATESSQEYYRNLVIGMVRMVYFMGILGGAKVDLIRFEETIKQVPELFEVSETFYNPSRHFPLYYVREWRKHGMSTKTALFFSYRIYGWLARTLAHIVKG